MPSADRLHRCTPAALLAAGLLAGWGLWPKVPPAVPAAPWRPLVHWQDARHDWLLVADPAAGRVRVYDAADGEPLRTFGAAQGLTDVRGLVLDGDAVWVLGTGAPRRIALPVVTTPREPGLARAD